MINGDGMIKGFGQMSIAGEPLTLEDMKRASEILIKNRITENVFSGNMSPNELEDALNELELKDESNK